MSSTSGLGSGEQGFVPLKRGLSRVDIELQDSETAAFHALLYLGELVVKLAAAAFVSGVQPDGERKAEAAGGRLVRAAGVGEHVAVLDEILVGPTFELLHPAFKPLQSQIVTKQLAAAEELRALASMRAAMGVLGIEPGEQAPATSIRSWLHWFVQIRNKTRGHGALQSEKLSAAYLPMRESMELLVSRLNVFQQHWAYVRRNLSGKYRVIEIGGAGSCAAFSALRSGERAVQADGVYISCGDRMFHAELVQSDADLSDFYVPNGCFQNGTGEFISLITGSTRQVTVSRFAAPVTIAPPSETEGKRDLDVVGKCLTNMPPRPSAFVERRLLGEELRKVLMEGRHEIVSLSGPGGGGQNVSRSRDLPSDRPFKRRKISADYLVQCPRYRFDCIWAKNCEAARPAASGLRANLRRVGFAQRAWCQGL